MNADEQKYIVFKAEDLEKIHWAELPSSVSSLPPDQYTVIKHTDVFAASALSAYANSIQTAIEIMAVDGPTTPDPRLVELRDLFYVRAEQARHMSCKIPD